MKHMLDWLLVVLLLASTAYGHVRIFDLNPLWRIVLAFVLLIWIGARIMGKGGNAAIAMLAVYGIVLVCCVPFYVEEWTVLNGALAGGVIALSAYRLTVLLKSRIAENSGVPGAE